jgi:sugar phosphate isomerase/epimerase
LPLNNQTPYISTGAFKTRSVSDIVDMAVRSGLQHIELASGTAWASGMLDVVRKTSGRSVHYLVHNYFPPHQNPFVLNLAAADETALRRSREHCRSAVDLCQELNAPFFSVHAGFAFAGKPENLGKDVTRLPRVSLEQAHEIFVASLRDLCAYAAGKRVRIAVENNVLHPFNLIEGQNRLGLCATAEDLLRTHADVGADNLGFLIDVGHLKVTANSLRFDREAFLDTVAPYTAAFHLSDNDGTADQNRPFGDEAWFLPRLAEFPDTTMILEAYSLDVPVIVETCRVIERACQRVRAV